MTTTEHTGLRPLKVPSSLQPSEYKSMCRNTQEWHRNCIEELAKKDFKDHVVTKETEDRWHVGKPGSGISSFRVICVPGYVILFGDVADQIFQHSDRDSLGWLKRAANTPRYPDYLLGKCQPVAGRPKEFLPGQAIKQLEWLRLAAWEEHGPDPTETDPEYAGQISNPERLENGLAEADLIFQRWVEESWRGEERAWRDAGYEVTGDCEWGDACDYSSRALWALHALCKFVELLDTSSST